MSSLPEPTPVPGIRWIIPTIADAPRIYDLYDAWTRAGNLSFRLSLDEIIHEMEAPNTDVASQYRFAVDDDGCLVASVVVHLHSVPDFKHRGYLFTTSLPGYGHAGVEAVRWGEARARQRFAEIGGGLTQVIRVGSDVRDTDRIARFEALGFTISRYFVDLIRPLSTVLPAVTLPDGVELRDWDEQWVVPAWETHCEAFADHWGALPPALDDWKHRFENPQFRPDLSVVAVADGLVASYGLSGVFPQVWELTGRKDGWIETLGTRRAWRRLGLASGVITEAMHRFKAAGLDHAALDVDTANPTGAFSVYERLGFSEVNRAVDLTKEFPPG